ncbi:hypothetical protein [Paenibacillus odorifer]|uniref:hypothetical protein n=1 Tax=Paenibacillus TaxID=44249 RepID=UPI00096D8A3D|nr:hypothetical protein [Paenibacillus odorifer]OMC98854.1 hypothetical protein BJP46_03790 [Paenibacillus odorifer]
MREGFNVQYEFESAIDLLSDMVINYISMQERRASYRTEVMLWLEPIELLEMEELANHELTSQLLETADYQMVA